MEIESVRTITEIIDAETGELLHIDNHFFHQNEAYLFLLRRRLYEYAYLKIGQPKYLCAVCRQPVVLLGKRTKRAHIVYFAHYKDSDDCPIKTRGKELSEDELNNLRYKGGESDYHIEIKHQISSALQTSHIGHNSFSHIQEEERIASKLDFRSWAVPDIYAECGNLRINFEVQLSTIFLSTIIERDIFYRSHGIFILWIFAPGAINNDTISRKDIIWTNNGNLFIYDQEAREITEQTGELTLLCRWYELVDNNADEVRLVAGKYLTLSDLTFDSKTNTVYYVDVASDIEKRHPNFKKERTEMEQMELETLDEFRVLLDGCTPTKEEVVEGLKSGLYKPRWIKKGNYWGYAKYGHTIIPFIYNHAEDFVDGFAIIRRNRKYGVVNMFGEEIVKTRYQEIHKFSEGLAAVKLNNRWGFVNTKGEEVIRPQFYAVVQDYQNGKAIVKRTACTNEFKINYKGNITINGDIEIELTYDEYKESFDGLTIVRKGHRYGVINLLNEEVVDIKYKSFQILDKYITFINDVGAISIMAKGVPYLFTTTIDIDQQIANLGNDQHVDRINKKEIIDLLDKNSLSICKTGIYYESKSNYHKAKEYYYIAADMGNTAALNKLGLYYKQGKIVEQDNEKAVEYYRKSAEQGYLYAQWNLAVCYENGEGVKKDNRQAFEWFKQAAEQGYKQAQNRLGIYYNKGVGVEKNLQKAVEYYLRSAEQGYASAQWNLALCYQKGEGIGQDYRQAFIWLKKAAEQGNMLAQKKLGDYYEQGLGVEKNSIKAEEWHKQAAEQELQRKRKRYLEKIQNEEGNKHCPLCGGSLIVRNGYRGHFYGCKNFPKCKYTEDINWALADN